METSSFLPITIYPDVVLSLAICEYLRRKGVEPSLLGICRCNKRLNGLRDAAQHCDEMWEPLGIAGGFRTVEEARQATERSYNGITTKWIDVTTTRDDALALHRADLKAASCSFCGRNPLEVSSMIGDEVRICNHCVESFHDALHSDTIAI